MHIFQVILRIDISFRGNSSPEDNYKEFYNKCYQTVNKNDLKQMNLSGSV